MRFPFFDVHPGQRLSPVAVITGASLPRGCALALALGNGSTGGTGGVGGAGATSSSAAAAAAAAGCSSSVGNDIE